MVEENPAESAGAADNDVQVAETTTPGADEHSMPSADSGAGNQTVALAMDAIKMTGAVETAAADSAAAGTKRNGGAERGAKGNHPPSPTAVQDMFLNGLRRENIDVVLYFCDGSQERGVVRAFDTFTLLVENRSSGKMQLVYKHSVARIFPVRSPQGIADRSYKSRHGQDSKPNSNR
jgi:host factor-I protein